MTLTTYCAPIRKTAVDAIDTEAVLSILKPLWERAPETASRLRGRIETVLDAAKARGLIGPHVANPARWRGRLDKLLPKRGKLARGHHAAMPYADVPAFLAALRERPAIAARALEFAVLTAVRSGEVMGARWDEFDLDAKVWTVPAGRTGEFVFPGQLNGPLSDWRRSMAAPRRWMALAALAGKCGARPSAIKTS